MIKSRNSRQFLRTSEERVAEPIDMKYRSANERLSPLNSQLQDTLERQRSTSDDLQNILYSIDVATLFLDTDLNIRFFTPATQPLFNFSQNEVGQPVASFQLLDLDDTLLLDARTVLKAITPIEREIESGNGSWYIRRV